MFLWGIKTDFSTEYDIPFFSNSSTKMSCMLLISLLICKSEILKYCFITSSIVLSLESIVYIVLLMFSKFYW